MVQEKKVIGYWAKEIVGELENGGFLGSEVAWGGLGRASKDGKSPPIGSGHYPDGFYDHASYFRIVQFVAKGSVPTAPPNYANITVDKYGCYDLQNNQNIPIPYWGYRFIFGGPGGSC